CRQISAVYDWSIDRGGLFWPAWTFSPGRGAAMLPEEVRDTANLYLDGKIPSMVLAAERRGGGSTSRSIAKEPEPPPDFYPHILRGPAGGGPLSQNSSEAQLASHREVVVRVC